MVSDMPSIRWFISHARKVIGRCRRRVAAVPGLLDAPANVYVPSGDGKYPSLWVRDAVMQCRSGLIPAADMEALLRLILACQNGPTMRRLKNGLRVDPWAVADHVNLPGLGGADFDRRNAPGAVFFPGTCATGEDQGNGTLGLRPSDDDIYETVELAALIARRSGPAQARQWLASSIKEVSIIDRLHFGMQAMTIDGRTGLCWNTPENWAAANFHDTLKPLGAVAISSCLRFRAACRMAGLFALLDCPDRMEQYRSIAEQIARSVAANLLLPSGWVMAGTELDRQPDVWSTAMAVYYGILSDEPRHCACGAMRRAYRDGSVAISGYLRHTPTWADDKPGAQVWEDGPRAGQGDYGCYMNGGYWPQPLGYYAYALAQIDPSAAAQIVGEFIGHTRRFADDGAPFEWINPAIYPEDKIPNGRWYGPSVALPLEGLRRLAAEGSRGGV